MKHYSEVAKLPTFKERVEYLYIGDSIGHPTFANARWMNQRLYTSQKWRRIRNQVILRDNGCDLGIEGCNLGYRNILVHHINPITEEDIINDNPCIFDLDNLICCSKETHNYIHFGAKVESEYTERQPNDTCPWRR